jgi:hypothetical protein
MKSLMKMTPHVILRPLKQALRILCGVSSLMIIFFALVLPASAADFNLTVRAGYLQPTEPPAKSVYGAGFIINPSLSVEISPYFSIQAAWEGGYQRSADIGLYQESSNLILNAWELSGIFHYPGWKPLVPYVKAGLISCGYRQDIDSAFIRRAVNHRSLSYSAAAGLKYYAGSNVFFLAELKYVPLKVRPFDVEVDLTGYRVLAGIGYRFSF